MTGSNNTEACRPPGARCDTPGGVLVATEMPRNRMWGTWYISDALLAEVAWSPWRRYGPAASTMKTSQAVTRPSFLNPMRIQP